MPVGTGNGKEWLVVLWNPESPTVAQEMFLYHFIFSSFIASSPWAAKMVNRLPLALPSPERAQRLPWSLKEHGSGKAMIGIWRSHVSGSTATWARGMLAPLGGHDWRLRVWRC